MTRPTSLAASLWCTGAFLLCPVVQPNEVNPYHPVVRSATDLLLENYWAGIGATIPSPNIDPHQDSTTSVLVAHAWAHSDQDRAQSELSSVFLGQWENGMVPSVRYAPGYSGDFLGGSLMLGPGGWDRNGTPPKAASGANTSGLAALPLHAEAALRIFNLSPRDADARLWLEGLFPVLFRYHDYLHREREDPDTGLLYLYHPWETTVALDSIFWNSLLNDTREQIAEESWSPPPIPEDVQLLPGFPGDEALGAAVFLAQCAADQGYTYDKIKDNCPFQLQDVQFNAVLLRSDKALLQLADILEATRSGWMSKVYTAEQYERLKLWATLAESRHVMSRAWDSENRAFLSRYTRAGTSETLLVRPATSSDFSGLLAPGLPLWYSLSAVDLLLNSGPLNFRCGEHPVPDIECSHANRDEPDDVTDEGTTNERMLGDSVVGEASNRVVGGSIRSGATSGKWLGESGVSQGWRGGVVHSGFPSGEADVHATGALREAYLETSSGKPSPEERSVLLEARKVEVFENLMAKRGFEEHELVGLTSWLANSTLALLAPGVRMAQGIEESAVAPSIDEGVRTTPEGRGVVSISSADDAPGRITSSVFHRVFGADSGLPLPDVEGNSSSMAAAISVLLVLGDGPERGNSFPPITHATLFVLMSIELAFSFAVGVSCLVLSLNLVRKLREEDSGSGRTDARGRAYTRGGADGYSYGSHAQYGVSSVPGMGRGLGNDGAGDVGMRGAMGIDEEYVGIGGASTAASKIGRRTGSFLPRGGRLQRDIYNADNGLEDDFERQGRERRLRREEHDRLQSDSEEEGAGTDASDERALYYGDEGIRSGSRRKFGRLSPLANSAQYYEAPPAADDRGVRKADDEGGVPRVNRLPQSSATGASELHADGIEGGLPEVSRDRPRTASVATDRGAKPPSDPDGPQPASVAPDLLRDRARARSNEGYLDMLRPIYNSIKLW